LDLIEGGVVSRTLPSLRVVVIAINIAALAPCCLWAQSTPRAKIRESVICCPLEPVSIDGWASIAAGSEITQWQWQVRGVIDTVTTSGELVLNAPVRPRSYMVVLRVRDKLGQVSNPDSALMTVMNSAPQVSLTHDTLVKIGTRIFFGPHVNVACGTISSFQWDLDDDGVFEYQSRDNGNTSKAYYKPGRFKSRFKVIDYLGHEAGAIVLVDVVGKAPK